MWEREIEFSKLLDQCESNPSNSCLKKIAYFAIEEEKLWYKHIVLKIEKRIRKCEPNIKMNYLHAMSAICKVAKKELGTQNKYRQRFKQQNKQIFGALSMVPLENHYKIKRTLEKWKNNEVFDHEFVELALKNLNQKSLQDGRGESSKSDPNFNCSNSNNFATQINSNSNQMQNIQNNNNNSNYLEKIEQNIVSNYDQENSTDLNIDVAEKQQNKKQMSDSQEKYSLNDVDNDAQQNCLIQNQIQQIQNINSNSQNYGSIYDQYNNQKSSLNLLLQNFEQNQSVVSEAKQAQNNTLQLNSGFSILNQQIQKTNSNQIQAQQNSQEILLQHQLLCNQFQVNQGLNNNQNFFQNGFLNSNPVQNGFQTAVLSQGYQNQQNQHFQSVQLQNLQQQQNSQNFHTKFNNLNLNNLNGSFHVISTNNAQNQANQQQIATNQENFQQYLTQLQQQIPTQNSIQQIQLNNFNLQNNIMKMGYVQNSNIAQGCVQNPYINISSIQNLGNNQNQAQYQHSSFQNKIQVQSVKNQNEIFEKKQFCQNLEKNIRCDQNIVIAGSDEQNNQNYNQSNVHAENDLNNLQEKDDILFDKDVGSFQVQNVIDVVKMEIQKKNQNDQSEIFYENQTQMQIETGNDYQAEKYQTLNQYSEKIQQNVQDVVNQEKFDDNCCQNKVELSKYVEQNLINVDNYKQIGQNNLSQREFQEQSQKRKSEIQSDQLIKKQYSSNSSQNHHIQGENICSKNNVGDSYNEKIVNNINKNYDGDTFCDDFNDNITCNIKNSDNNIDCKQNDKNYCVVKMFNDISDDVTCNINDRNDISNNVDVFDDKSDDNIVKKRCVTELGCPIKQYLQTKFLYQPYLYRIVSVPGESEQQNLSFNIEPLDEFTPNAPPKLELHFDIQQQYQENVNKIKNLNNETRYGSVDQSPQTCCVIKVFNGEDSPRGFLCDEEEIKKTVEKPRKSECQSESALPPGTEIYPHQFFSNLRNLVIDDKD